MNVLILFNLIFVAYLKVTSGDQLYHREGRFIDLSIHRYKTQLPSIHDIAHGFIHYRMPVALFVPTVRLNIKPKQKRIHYSNFPSASKKVQENQSDPQSKAPAAAIEQETQMKDNNKPDVPSQPVISRTGWTARSLSKPKSFNPLFRSRSLDQAYKKSSLNYASVLPSESNVDLMPFLYKDNLPSQTSNLFNSPYHLTNSNPSHMFSQNIAYIQPNSLSPFQPNILLLTTSPERSIPDQMKNENQSIITEKQLNNTIGANNTMAVLQSNQQKANSSISFSNNSSFDFSQVSDNSDEISLDHVQNHEPVENVPVSPVQPVGESSVDGGGVMKSTVNDVQINNSTLSIANDQPNEQMEKQLDTQPIVQPTELRDANIVNELTIVDPPFYRSGRLNRSNFVNRLYLPPASFSSSNRIKPKLTMPNRTHRSLSIDMPSFSSLLTAAAAQSGHSKEEKKMLFNKFLDDNSN